jgi:ADP-ribose pyrophosphatase
LLFEEAPVIQASSNDLLFKALQNSMALIPSNATFPNLDPNAPHIKCTTQVAPGYPDREIGGPVPFSQPNVGYQPVSYTSAKVLAQPDWADDPDVAKARESRPDGRFQSYVSEVNQDMPENPKGRTGIEGRGLLGKWGANFAADPIVTRTNPETGKLEMIAIRRTDSGQWAIPGGMADFGEGLSGTLSRELAEEALGKEGTPERAAQLETLFAEKFEKEGRLVYEGYVDDPRNTDNAWMETRAVHLHLTGDDARIDLHAGDDADGAQWMEINQENMGKLYASHGDFVGKAVQGFQESTGSRVLIDGTVA